MSASSGVHVLGVNHLGVIPPKYMFRSPDSGVKSPDSHPEYISGLTSGVHLRSKNLRTSLEDNISEAEIGWSHEHSKNICSWPMSASSGVHVLGVNHLGVIPPKYMSEVQTPE
jgi:hypothetical protein